MARIDLLRGVLRGTTAPSEPHTTPSEPRRTAPVDPEGASDPGWDGVWSTWRDVAGADPGSVWILDDADLLPPAAWEEFRRAWSEIRGQALPVHLLLTGRIGVADRLGDLPHERAEVSPLPSASWLSRTTPWSPIDRVRAAAVFGRSPALHAAADPSSSVDANIATLLLAPGAPFATFALDALRSRVQRPQRYLRVVRALADGLHEWGDIVGAVDGLSSSGQLGPYMKTLEGEGLVVADRSLDAPARSRSRRWRIADPHLGFWFGCAVAAWDRIGAVDAATLWKQDVEPLVDAHVDRALPVLVREWLASDAAGVVLGSAAREAGGLWGDGYDIDVAGTLRNGAIVYGWTRWTAGSFHPDEVEARLEQVRGTRYGFGRETRLKLFLQRDPPGHELARRDARDPDILVLSVADLVPGSAASPLSD